MVKVYYNNFPCPSSKRPMVIYLRKCALREDKYPNILRIVGYRFQTSIYIWMHTVLTSEARQPCSRRPLLLTITLQGPLPNEKRNLSFFLPFFLPLVFSASQEIPSSSASCCHSIGSLIFREVGKLAVLRGDLSLSTVLGLLHTFYYLNFLSTYCGIDFSPLHEETVYNGG